MEEEFKDELFLIKQRIRRIESEFEKFRDRISIAEQKPVSFEKVAKGTTVNKEKILNDVNRLVKEYFSINDYEFVPGQTKIPLQVPSYGWEEVAESVESLLSTWVTMGKKVKQFEEIFANYIGTNYATMVNSGSSANLLALSVLTNPLLRSRIKPGEEIITPAVTWATTVYPIANVNGIPVIVDVDLETFNIKTEDVEKAITEKTRAIMPVHLLGNPCDIKRIMEIAEEHSLFVIEDTCEAYGATINGKKVGSFGDLSTFSFFLSHHITTVEGGMVLTNNEEFFELAKALRAFGWIRDLKDKDEIAERYKNIDKRFLFVNIGYNFRPTEIQGAFGIHQMKKLEKFIEIRRENAKYWNDRLSEFSDYLILTKEKPGTRHVWFGYPITVRSEAPFTKEELVRFLEESKIETRPIMTGNMAEHPVMNLINHRLLANDLTNSRFIMNNSFFFGNHQAIGKEEREYIADKITEFIESKVRR